MPDPVKTTEQELAELMLELSSNPATRGETLRAIKKIRPETAIPELDNQDALEKAKEEMRAENDKLRQEWNQDRLTAALDRKRAEIKDRLGLSDEDVTAAETLFKEGKIGDYDTAAEHVRLRNQLSTPTPSRRTRVKPFEGIDFEKFQADPEGAALEQMYKDMDEISSGRVNIQ